jgi:hypothetical protein
VTASITASAANVAGSRCTVISSSACMQLPCLAISKALALEGFPESSAEESDLIACSVRQVVRCAAGIHGG